MPIPWMYCRPNPSAAAGAVESFTTPPSAPPASLTDDVPCSSEASSMKYDGIIEKSVMPSIGLLMRIPFHVTCVCEGPVPRNETVESVARPYCLTKSGELNVSTSAIDRAMFSLSVTESSVVRSTPISFIGRRPQIGTSRMAMFRSGRASAAASCGGCAPPWAWSAAGNSSAATIRTVVFLILPVSVISSRMRRV